MASERLGNGDGSSGAARALRQVAHQAALADEAATRLAASGPARAAAGEELRRLAAGVEAGVEAVALALTAMTRAQQGLGDGSREAVASLEATGSGLAEVTASVEGVRKDTDGLARSVEATISARWMRERHDPAAVEERRRGIVERGRSQQG